MSIEPGIISTHKKLSIGVTAPVALYHNRERSVAAMRWTPPGHGDAAFADFNISSTISCRF